MQPNTSSKVAQNPPKPPPCSPLSDHDRVVENYTPFGHSYLLLAINMCSPPRIFAQSNAADYPKNCPTTAPPCPPRRSRPLCARAYLCTHALVPKLARALAPLRPPSARRCPAPQLPPQRPPAIAVDPWLAPACPAAVDPRRLGLEPSRPDLCLPVCFLIRLD